MKRGERKPYLMAKGVGLVTPISEPVEKLVDKGVPVDTGMDLEQILDFARWQEHGYEMKLHYQMGEVWAHDVRTPIIDGRLAGTRLPGW